MWKTHEALHYAVVQLTTYPLPFPFLIMYRSMHFYGACAKQDTYLSMCLLWIKKGQINKRNTIHCVVDQCHIAYSGPPQL